MSRMCSAWGSVQIIICHFAQNLSYLSTSASAGNCVASISKITHKTFGVSSLIPTRRQNGKSIRHFCILSVRINWFLEGSKKWNPNYWAHQFSWITFRTTYFIFPHLAPLLLIMPGHNLPYSALTKLHIHIHIHLMACTFFVAPLLLGGVCIIARW